MTPTPRDVLARSALFEGLSAEAFERLVELARPVELRAGELLFEEGDEPRDFYVLASGSCDVVKRDPEGFSDVVARIGPGDAVGELPLLAPDTRSATVRVTEDAKLVALSLGRVRDLLRAGTEGHPYATLQGALQRRLVERLKGTNDLEVGLLRDRARHAEERARASTFTLFLVCILCVFMFVTQWLAGLTKAAAGTTVYTGPIMLVLVVSLVYPIRRLALPWRTYGVTTEGWRPALRDGVVFSIPLLLATTALKAALVHLEPGWSDRPVLDLTWSLSRVYAGDEGRALRHFVLFNGVYVALIVPAQEFVSRGLLQGLFERFLESRFRTVLAIVASNLVFSAFHLYLSVGVALATFLLGLYLGWVYTRTRNLLGVCVLHAAVGTWALSVVRIHPWLS